MDDAFQAPTGGDDDKHFEPTGKIELGRAVVTGVNAGLTHWHHVVVVYFWYLLLSIVPMCLCGLPWLVTVPVLVWGIAAWALAVIDGQGELSDLWKGAAEDLGTTFMRGWGWLLMMVVIMIPFFGIIAVVAGFSAWRALQTGGQPDPWEQTALTIGLQFPMMIYEMLVIRFALGIFYVVERRARVVEALTLSWNQTAESWGALALLLLGWFVLNFPISAVNQYAAYVYQTLPVGKQLENFGLFYAFIFGSSSVSTMMGVLLLLVLAAAYRQLLPNPPETRI